VGAVPPHPCRRPLHFRRPEPTAVLLAVLPTTVAQRWSRRCRTPRLDCGLGSSRPPRWPQGSGPARGLASVRCRWTVHWHCVGSFSCGGRRHPYQLPQAALPRAAHSASEAVAVRSATPRGLHVRLVGCCTRRLRHWSLRVSVPPMATNREWDGGGGGGHARCTTADRPVATRGKGWWTAQPCPQEPRLPPAVLGVRSALLRKPHTALSTPCASERAWRWRPSTTQAQPPPSCPPQQPHGRGNRAA